MPGASAPAASATVNVLSSYSAGSGNSPGAAVTVPSDADNGEELCQLLNALRIDIITADLQSDASSSIRLDALRFALQPFLPARPSPLRQSNVQASPSPSDTLHVRQDTTTPTPSTFPPIPPYRPMSSRAYYDALNVAPPFNGYKPFVRLTPARLPMELLHLIVEIMARDRMLRSLIKVSRTNSALFKLVAKVMWRDELQLHDGNIAPYVNDAFLLARKGEDEYLEYMLKSKNRTFDLRRYRVLSPLESAVLIVPEYMSTQFPILDRQWTFAALLQVFTHDPQRYKYFNPCPELRRITLKSPKPNGKYALCTIAFDLGDPHAYSPSPTHLTVRCITGVVFDEGLARELRRQIWTRPLQSLSLHIDTLHTNQGGIGASGRCFPEMVPPVHVNHITISLPCKIGKPSLPSNKGDPTEMLADRLHILYVWLNLLARRSTHPVVVELVGVYCWWDKQGVNSNAANNGQDGLLRNRPVKYRTSDTELYDPKCFCRLADRRTRVQTALRKIDRLVLVDRCSSVKEVVEAYTTPLEEVISHQTTAPLGRAQRPIPSGAQDKVYVVFTDLRPWTTCSGCGLYMASTKPHALYATRQHVKPEISGEKCMPEQLLVYRWKRVK